MFRWKFLVASSSLVFLPVVDTAIKGCAIFTLAAAICWLLRRDSAATRHLVWATAMVLMLIMPVLSLVLPEWRILPGWPRTHWELALGNVPRQSHASPADTPASWPAPFAPQVEKPSANLPFPEEPHAVPPVRNPVSAQTAAAADAADPSPLSAWDQQVIWGLSLVWLAGCLFLGVRLGLASLLLRNSARRCRILVESASALAPAHNLSAKHAAMNAVLAACAQRLQVRQSVTLILDSEPSMPAVWGLWKACVRLPADAVHWSTSQLESVLMHELAHVRRRDLIVLMQTQLVCMIYWFHPLVWIAAWRLHQERERACDDLVLQAGIQPSSYAEHLMEIVRQFKPGGCVQAVGLAMARKSSLEKRLNAILSGQVNRRSIPRLLALAVMIAGLMVGIPVAMLQATDPPAQDAVHQSEPMQDPATERQNTGAPPQALTGAPLTTFINDRLQWGEPTNGLRAALIRPQLFEPDAGEIFDLKLAVQNVSSGPIRFSTAAEKNGSRKLYLWKDGEILAAFHDEQPGLVEVLLQPQEVAILPLFSNRSEGQSITAEISVSFEAVLEIDPAAEGHWHGKLRTADCVSLFAGCGLLPKNKDGQALLQLWNKNARYDGKIPGALIGELAKSILTFTKNNPTWETTPQLTQMLASLDTTHDWNAAEAVKLLDDLAELQDTPLSMALDAAWEQWFRTGTPLTDELKNAPWGAPDASGLRLAWLLDPQAAEYRMGTPLKSRILIHNAGTLPVMFVARNWHQINHQAKAANGAEITVDSVDWTTRGRLIPFRVAPGDYVELSAAGIGVGPNTDHEDWQHTRVGSWIVAQPGDAVTMTTDPVPLFDWGSNPQPGEPAAWWPEFVKARVAREQPLPVAKRDRERLMDRMVGDLFGTAPSKEELAEFVADESPTALDALASRLIERSGCRAFAGSLVSAPTQFSVLPPDPDAATRPRTACNPGRYTLAPNAVLVVSRQPMDERLVNNAAIQFFNSETGQATAAKACPLQLPDGYDTWVAAWNRGGTELWVQQESGFDRYDFSNPANVRISRAERREVPPAILKAQHEALPDLKSAPVQNPPPPASTRP